MDATDIPVHICGFALAIGAETNTEGSPAFPTYTEVFNLPIPGRDVPYAFTVLAIHGGTSGGDSTSRKW